MFNQREFYFGKGQSSLFNAFKNICEILNLKDFSVYKVNENHLVLFFEGSYNQYFKEFIIGICEGIFEIRKLSRYKIELEDLRNKTKISIFFDQIEGVAM
jgi:hypothetical protein